MSFVIQSAKQVHASKPDSGFTLPPQDGSLTISEIFDFNYEHNPGHLLFVYPNASGELVKVTYAEAVPAAHRAARYVAEIANIDLDADPATFPTVAVVALSGNFYTSSNEPGADLFLDTITYAITVLGLLRAGIPAFLLSTRSTPPAAVALFTQMKPSIVLISQEVSIRELADITVQQLRSTNALVPEVHPMPVFEQLFVKDAPFSPLPARKHDFDVPRVILHSSGELRWG